MKKWVIAAVAAALALAGTWYWASPALAMNNLRNALVKGDRSELAERIDFPAIRESLKSQMSAMMVAEMAKKKDEGNAFAALGGMLATAMVGPMIDGIVTPDGLKAVVQHARFKSDAEVQARPEQKWNVERDGFDKFTAIAATQPGEKAPKLLFKRDGLGWRLVDIEMPEGGMSNE